MTASTARLSLEDVLDKAGALFAAHGFDGVSFRDITEVTDAKRSLLLYHFGSKEELWRRAMKRLVERFDAALAGRFRPGPEHEDETARVVALTRAYIETLIEIPDYGKVLLREGVTPGPRLDWLIRNFTPAIAFEPRLRDAEKDARLRGSMLRDVVIGAPLFATALGPFLEASTAAATRTSSAGIYPMTPERRDELVALMVNLILG